MQVSQIHIRYRHLGPEWDILDEFGFFPAELTQWQDVENVSGFLGAYREGRFTINIDD